MIYVFDTSMFIHLFTFYYIDTFPTLWERFDSLVKNKQIISVSEVLEEIKKGHNTNLLEWSKEHNEIFYEPTAKEFEFIRKMFKDPFYQNLISKTKLYTGGDEADPFVIAKAACTKDSFVVTNEGYYTDGNMKLNAPKIPFICSKLGVGCLSPIGFMRKANWEF